MKRILFVTLLSLCCGSVSAQPQIRAKKILGGKITEFYLEKKDRPGTLTVFLTFTELHNCTSLRGTTKYEVKHDGRLVSLRAADESYGVGYCYEWRYFYGAIDPVVDTAFVYRMPCSTTKPVWVVRTVPALDKYRQICRTGNCRELGFHFELEKGDTVYAMRRGVVTVIKKGSHSDPGVSFTTESTNITVEQPDGSFAYYVCLDGDNLFVGEGDELLPSQPLGLAGSYDGEHYKVSVQIYRYVSDPGPDPETGRKRLAVSEQFLPCFATTGGALVPGAGGSYTPVATEEMVTREMTGKELERYNRN